MRALLLLLALGAASCAEDLEDLPALGTLERDRLELVAEADEPVLEHAVREGDRVEAGALLVRQGGGRVAAQADRARGTRDEARARLDELSHGPRVEQVAEARAQLAGTESALRIAKRERERAESLAEADFASRARLDQAHLGFDAARASRDAARARLTALETGSRSEEIARGQGALEAADATLSEAELRRQRLEVRAPRSGIVDALPFEPGERPPPGATVVVLVADGPPWARVYVPEPLRTRLRPGTRAHVRVDGYAEPFEGRLRSVSHEPAFTPYFALTQRDRSRLSYLAEVDVTSPEALELPAGIPVEVTFDLEGAASEARSEPQASGVIDAR
jgi:HlyD family secretion protein